MPGQVRQPDIDSMGHPNITSSPDTFCNNLKVTRITDSRPCPGIDIGVHNVYTNNLDNQTIGDMVSSGHAQVQGSTNTFVN